MRAIELKNVSKIYKNGVKALAGVSLTVKQGEFIAVYWDNQAVAKVPCCK